MFSNLITIILSAVFFGALGYLFALIGKNDSNLPKPIKVFWGVSAIVAFLFLINGALGW
jgi:hypothetical protein